MLHAYLGNNSSFLVLPFIECTTSKINSILRTGSFIPYSDYSVGHHNLTKFQVGLILIISTRRNAYVTVTATLAGTYVYKLVVWVACGNKDSVLKLLGCVVSFFVGVSNLSHVEPNFTFDVHFILYDNC